MQLAEQFQFEQVEVLHPERHALWPANLAGHLHPELSRSVITSLVLDIQFRRSSVGCASAEGSSRPECMADERHDTTVALHEAAQDNRRVRSATGSTEVVRLRIFVFHAQECIGSGAQSLDLVASRRNSIRDRQALRRRMGDPPFDGVKELQRRIAGEP